MRFVSLVNSVIGKSRRGVSQGLSVGVGSGAEDESKADPTKLVEQMRQMMARINKLESTAVPEASEFEINAGSGTVHQLTHNYNSPVRWWVTHWVHQNGVVSPIYAPAFVRDDSTTAKVLVLRSYVAGQAIVRVEPATAVANDAGVTVGDFFGPINYGPTWSMVSGASAILAAATAGNFTTGVQFNVSTPCSCTGVRFYAAVAAAKTIKAKLYNAAGTLLASNTISISKSGIYTVQFATAQALTPFSLYKVAIYQTDGLNYNALVMANVNAPARPFFAGGVVVYNNTQLFLAGDTNPTTTAGAEGYPVEPILAAS